MATVLDVEVLPNLALLWKMAICSWVRDEQRLICFDVRTFRHDFEL